MVVKRKLVELFYTFHLTNLKPLNGRLLDQWKKTNEYGRGEIQIRTSPFPFFKAIEITFY